MDQKINPIQPPPSVDDLLALGSDARVGQVDFATVASPITATPAAPTATPTPAPRPTTRPTTRPVIEAVPEAAPAAEEPAIDLEPVDDTTHLGDSIQQVADAAIERLRDAENATLRHLLALEAEAARRAELLTAQAELDAELIRLHARREAHAIITAAHARTGDGPSPAVGRQLGEISGAVSRFADSIEPILSPLGPRADLGDAS